LSGSLKSPQQLYLDWEHAQWASQDIDLSRDPDDWAELERKAVRDESSLGAVVRARLVDPLPAVRDAVAPPSEGGLEALGIDVGELAEFGLGALDRRLGIIGVSLG